MKHVLIVDDDPNIRQLVTVHLNKRGFHLLQAENGFQALEILENEKCDLAIIDIMMPVMDGIRLTEEIRRYYDIPIILLTAKRQIEDKEKGYTAGTDDYLVKPFEPKELIFRIQALLRRYGKQNDAIIKLGKTTINRKNYEIQIGDQAILLPLKEFELLYFLASHPNQVFSRDHLITEIWGLDYEGKERTVDVHIKRLRERLKPRTNDFYIKTIRGVGYALEEQT